MVHLPIAIITTQVKKQESSNAHVRDIPYFAPDETIVVTLPVPMMNPIINIPGPMEEANEIIFFLRFDKLEVLSFIDFFVLYFRVSFISLSSFYVLKVSKSLFCFHTYLEFVFPDDNFLYLVATTGR